MVISFTGGETRNVCCIFILFKFFSYTLTSNNNPYEVTRAGWSVSSTVQYDNTPENGNVLIGRRRTVLHMIGWSKMNEKLPDMTTPHLSPVGCC